MMPAVREGWARPELTSNHVVVNNMATTVHTRNAKAILSVSAIASWHSQGVAVFGNSSVHPWPRRFEPTETDHLIINGCGH